MTDAQPEDDAPERTREERLAELAEKLCRSYTYGIGIEELEQTDPEEASAHRDAAEHLLPWIQEAPQEDRRAAFHRGYAKGKENQAKHTAEDMQRLEAEVTDLRIDRDPEGLRWRIRDLERAWDELWVGHTGRRDIRDVTRQAHERAAAAERKLAEARELLAQSGLEASDPVLFGKLAARLEPRASDGP
ncbi:hypothetical protein OH809_45480 (plasmid) [Streptomyces sp. NBC_00873]|uniref:hypothetical protein n=1 Tax=Streptomyces sp. NBC_00873 TaxID=2975852 RepID=UPI0037DDDCA9|nr:hypothetical protein OH809_45480 [Streptomyces sp. NBC_00873]